jgi:rare lipoprotein A (peptidoglycan hydrolase)
MDLTRAFHAGSTGSNPVRGTTEKPSKPVDLGAANRAKGGSSRMTSPSSAEEPSHSHVSRALGIAAIAIMLLLGWTNAADAAPAHRWKSTTATWYGPGFYGNGTACGQTYTPRIRGVAIGHVNGRWLARCGDVFVIRHRNRAVRVRVIDRCPGCSGESHRFDLSARTAMDLCDCWQPYTMRVKWRAVR